MTKANKETLRLFAANLTRQSENSWVFAYNRWKIWEHGQCWYLQTASGRSSHKSFKAACSVAIDLLTKQINKPAEEVCEFIKW